MIGLERPKLNMHYKIGKYYPAVSSYMGGKVTFNFGPDFKYPPPEGSSPYFLARKITFGHVDIPENLDGDQNDSVLMQDVSEQSTESIKEEEDVHMTDENLSSGVKMEMAE